MILTVFNSAECVALGVGVQYELYTIQNGACMNTPPGIDTSTVGIPYLSYRAAVNGGTPAGQECFLTAFRDKECKGSFQGLIIEDVNLAPCENVLVGGAGTVPGLGAKSSRLDCTPKK